METDGIIKGIGKKTNTDLDEESDDHSTFVTGDSTDDDDDDDVDVILPKEVNIRSIMNLINKRRKEKGYDPVFDPNESRMEEIAGAS